MGKYSSNREKWKLQKRAQRAQVRNQEPQQQNSNQDSGQDFEVEDPFAV